MSFGGLIGNSNSSGGTRMVACTAYSNTMPTAAAMAHQPQLVNQHVAQPLSLALKPKMDGFGENFNVGGMSRAREDEFDSRSGSDNFEGGASGDDQENTGRNNSFRRGRYHRHTPSQIQELEAAFKENPHPDDKTRLELGRRLNLANKQVKFWFQNRRTQLKTQLERNENAILKQENDKLRMENIAFKEAIRNPLCTTCGGPAALGDVSIDEQHLRIENARLKEELNRLSSLGNKFYNRSASSLTSSMPPLMGNSGLELAVGRNSFGGGVGLSSMGDSLPMGLDFSNGGSSALAVPSAGPSVNMSGANVSFDKPVFLELALAAMDELEKLAHIDSPLWFGNVDTSGQILNREEYTRAFPPCIGKRPSEFVTEATKARGTIIANAVALVEMLMDVNRWADMFSCIVGKASTLEVISSGMGGTRNGALQVMQADLQILSPLVPSRQVKFIRHCKQLAQGVWAVVDISIDSSRDSSNTPAYKNCRRLPSGCIIHELPNGYSKVTWVEHTEYDENLVHHFFRPLIRAGMGFGAQKWVAVLQRQCECYATILSSTNSNGDPSVITPLGKRSILKLAQRMTRNFCAGVCASNHYWEVVQDGNAEEARLLLRRSIGNDGEPPGIVMSATTTIWMPVSKQQLFDFLRNEQSRCQWDVLSQEGPMHPMLHIPKGRGPGNTITLLRTSASSANASPNSTLILQDSCTDLTESLIVYAAIDVQSMNVAMNGGDSSCLALLPSGFSIVPDCFQGSTESSNGNGTLAGEGGGGANSGCLLTVGFQILLNSLPTTKLDVESINTINNLISRTLEDRKLSSTSFKSVRFNRDSSQDRTAVKPY